MTTITCPAGQALHIDAHTSPTAGVNTIVATRNGVDTVITFAGPTYTAIPESQTIEWSTSAPVTLECVTGASNIATAAGTSAAAAPPLPAAAGPLPFTGGHEIPALLLGGACLIAAAPILWAARRMARAV